MNYVNMRCLYPLRNVSTGDTLCQDNCKIYRVIDYILNDLLHSLSITRFYIVDYIVDREPYRYGFYEWRFNRYHTSNELVIYFFLILKFNTLFKKLKIFF